MDIRPVKVQQSNPVVVAFDSESFLSLPKDVQCFSEAAHLHECNAIKRSRLCFFIAHSDLAELFDCPFCKGCSLFRQVELKVNLCFVEVAQRDVTRAAGELLPDTRKTLQRLAIKAPQIVKIRPI